MVLKRSTAQIPAAPLVHNDSPLKFFVLKQEFIKNLEFFGKLASYPFRKVIYVPTNNLKLQSYSRKSIFTLPIISKFQLWSQIGMKLNKLCAEILIIKSTTHNAFKTLSCIKIYPLELKISLIVLPKTCEIGWKCDVDFSRFHTFFGLQLKISRVPGVRFWYKIAFWKRYEL